MKKIILTSFLTFFSLYSLIAQTPCDGGRYSSTVFSNFTKTSNIQFGQNNSFTGANYNLKLDFQIVWVKFEIASLKKDLKASK